jgi:hypothetical protein
MASLIVKITGDASGFKSVAGSLNRDLDSIATRAEKVGGSISSLGSTLSIGLSAPLLALGGVAVKASADMDSLRRALVTTTGSASEASKQFARLEEIAKLPAIGLEEAVRGSIRLQNYGLSAELAEKAMRGFSNAIGSSGGSADDTNEALRQLGQTFGRQKVTMDNLRIILERVPQAAKIIREEFGSEALADPAKALEKLGVNSEQFVTILINRLNDAQKVAPGLKTEIENLGQEFQKTAAAVGDQLAPAIRDMIGYMSDGLKIVADFAKGFADMPKPIQQIGLAFAGFLVTAPLVITAVGTIITNFGVIAGAAGTISTAVAGFATTIGTYGAATSAAVGLMAGAWVAGAAVAVYSVGTLTSAFYQLYAAQSKLDTSTNSLAFSIEKLLERVRKQHPEVGALELQYRAGKLSAEDFSVELRRLASGMESTTVQADASKPFIKWLGDAHGAAAEAVVKHAKAMESAKLPSSDLLALFERMKEAASAKQKSISDLADIMGRYGVVTAEAALKAARALDILFVSYRQLSDAPDLGNLNKIDFSKLPKAPDAGLPGPGGFEEFKRMGRNVGPEGMLTREQADAIKDRYKQVGKAGQAAMRQVSTVVTDLSRGIADILFKGGKFGDMMANVAKQAGQAITRELIEGALKKLATRLLDVGGIFGKVFGGGTGVVKSVSGGMGDLGGAATGGLGGASSAIGGAASAGITGIVGAVSGVVSAVSGVIGNFQMAGMNKSLDLIEHEVRYSQIHLLNTLNKANEYWPYMKNCWESLLRIEQRGAGLAGGGGMQVNMAGAYFLTDAAFDEFMAKQARWLKAQGL